MLPKRKWSFFWSESAQECRIYDPDGALVASISDVHSQDEAQRVADDFVADRENEQ
jgi:hypothetical protein